MSGDNEADQVNLAAAALAISLFALFATVIQLMQQYVLTAGGYHKVGQKVMDYWGKSRKLRILMREFRVEVQFETPVVFVCEPWNKRFPAGDKAWFIHDKSRIEIERDLRRRWDRETLTYFLLWGWVKWVFGKKRWWWEEEEDDTKRHGVLRRLWRRNTRPRTLPRGRPPPNPKKGSRVNTTNADLTSWVRLLEGLQTMEEASMQWQLDVCARAIADAPPSAELASTDVASYLADAVGCRSVMVALQPFPRSWDTMPAGLTKPFATTTMCHLMEMLAMLNVYWNEFDRNKNRYRAEGNGLVVTGTLVPELGLTFSINTYGKSRFEENRLIPVDGIKDLCFGKADTVYAETIDSRRLEPAEIENMSSLQLSTSQEIADTLRVIGCNTNTVNMFLQEKRTTHLFPVVFELLGMLARTFHLKNTLFRFLPNPTKFTWDRREFSLGAMLFAYQELLAEDAAKDSPPSPVKTRILELFSGMEQCVGRLQDRRRHQQPEPLFLQLLHAALDELDELLTAKKKTPRAAGPATPAKESPSETPAQAERRKIVRDVLRSHVQTVLYVLNREEEDSRTPRMSRHALSIEYRIPEHLLPNGACIEDIDGAPPEGDNNKQKVLMELYFDSIRPYVIDQARGTTDQRARWKASARREHLSAAPGGKWVPKMPDYPGVKRAPTDPLNPGKSISMDDFRSPGIKHTWTLPSEPDDDGSTLAQFLSFAKLKRLEREKDRLLAAITSTLPKSEAMLRGGGAASGSAQGPAPEPSPKSRPGSSSKPKLLSSPRDARPPSPSSASKPAVPEPLPETRVTAPSPPLPPPPPSQPPLPILPQAVVAPSRRPELESEDTVAENGERGDEKAGQDGRNGAATEEGAEEGKEGKKGAETKEGREVEEGDQGLGETVLGSLKTVSHDEVWCVLVFRMLCWLALHDFHKRDVQMVDSELLGSRLPVFVA